jgi:hypothetical protein
MSMKNTMGQLETILQFGKYLLFSFGVLIIVFLQLEIIELLKEIINLLKIAL